MKPHVRWMIRRDMEEVLEMERRCFEFPWTEEEFIKCLRERNVIGMIAEHDERVIGQMIYELHKDRLHLLNFAVHPEYQRQGVGKRMVEKIKSKLSEHRRRVASANVRETNENAQYFFRQQGFICTAIVEGKYAKHKPEEPAYYFEYFYDDEECGVLRSSFIGKAVAT